MSLKIYLLRHGETSYSQNGTYCGSIDPGLPAGSVSVVKFDSHGPMLEILGDRNYMPTYLRERKGT